MPFQQFSGGFRDSVQKGGCIIHQSTQNLTLISKMYNFMHLSCVVLELFLKSRFFARFFEIRSDPVQIKRFIENNSRTTQDKCIKLYIFEISVKFCVD